MAIRRTPQGFGPTAGMAGGMTPEMMAGGGAPGAGAGGPRIPRPPMTGAPTGNANPAAQNGIPMAPPPIDLSAGGPTSPFNIDAMLKTNQGAAAGQPGQPGPGPGGPQGMPGQPTRRAPLMPWGSSQGTPAAPATPAAGEGGAPSPMGGGPGAMPGGAGAQNDPSQGPLVMLRLLKAMGQV